MRNLFCSGAIVIALFCALGAWAQPVTATTSDGRTLLINPDGTWKEMPDGAMVKGKVNLSFAGMKQLGSQCWMRFRLENLTETFFKDYAPRMTAFDKNKNAIGQYSSGSETNNFRPGAVAILGVAVENIPCADVTEIVISGFSHSCQREAYSLCEESLNVVPSKEIPLVRH